MKKELLRSLPRVDYLLKSEKLEKYGKSLDYYTFSSSIRDGLKNYRDGILSGEIKKFSELEIIKEIENIINKKTRRNLRKVINGTGTIIHTNLGRSIFSKELLEKSFEVLTSYNNLEYNLETGKRGSRYSHLENLICEVTGAEGAVVVNNNAAAVLLCLNEFANNKEVIISRGELVEIGGSFRIPEIMKFSGAILKEVGTTNRTYIEDYKNNIDENTGILMKVHTSNYKIQGFTHETKREEISKLARENNLISIEDVGSGVLIDFGKYGIKREVMVQDILKSGIDIVTFSGDKLLGGPQAGIIVGKKELIDRLKKNQYLRTIRVDKIIISVLENIFRLYRDEKDAIKNIPTLKYILEDEISIKKRAFNLSKLLEDKNISNKVIKTAANIGGGSMPEEKILSYGVEFNLKLSPIEIEKKLRNYEIPIIGRIEKDRYIIDVKAIEDVEINSVADIISNALLEGK